VIPGKSLQDDYLRVVWYCGAPYATGKKSTESELRGKAGSKSAFVMWIT
jgi:hypothetical protein